MNFTINSNDLLNKLNLLTKAQNSKNTIPILDCVKVELTQGYITLTTSNNEITLVTKLPVSEESDINQKICIKSSLLLDALRELPNQPIQIIANDNNYNVEIRYKSGHFLFVGQSAEEYPGIVSLPDNANEITLPASVVLTAIQNTLACQADDELRPIMNGTYCDFHTDGDVVFVSSDGHRLARDTFHNLNTSGQSFGFVLPAKTTQLLKNVLDKLSEDISFSFNNSNAVVKAGDTIVYSRLLEGRYPNYNSVIPIDNSIIVIIDRNSIISTLRRIMVFASDSTGLIALNVKGNDLKVSAENLDFSQSSEETIFCEHSGNDISIGFKGTLLHDLLKLMPAGNIKLHFSSHNHAGIITPAEQGDEEEILMLLMPMQLQ